MSEKLVTLSPRSAEYDGDDAVISSRWKRARKEVPSRGS